MFHVTVSNVYILLCKIRKSCNFLLRFYLLSKKNMNYSIKFKKSRHVFIIKSLFSLQLNFLSKKIESTLKIK